ncbi:DMT family transporter [Desulfovibrio legallii]|jgi:drug/metabolite transporter (DMT)-like permease|uniref:Permease of the drug/metabolite transporter (DMT) superfamily n=1 Tax=Desulfovibrio legallii TaxID=571438 RepID=A0A1G7Q543_9BACT|nr:DMT family transporter [Desulfovibrio legallii]SDF93603.1 Permease of the drug/metabolite transporter (DMT) superfamily [Desulfovibrio legallii]
MSPTRSTLLPHLALLTAMAFWGSTFVVLRVALAAFTPLQTMTGRMLVACLALLPFWPRLFRELRRNGHWGLLALMGLCEPCLFFLFETHALGLTTASQAGMVTALLPMLVAAAAYVALGERSGPRVWLGFALAVGGVVWLSGTATAEAAAVNPALGNLLEAAAMCCATGYTLLARRLSPFYSPLCITAVQAAAGLIFFSLLLCFVPESPARVDLGRTFPAWAPWACVLYLGGCVTFAGYGLYNLGVNRLSAGRAAAYTNLIPVFALFFGILLLDERLNPGQYAGAALIVAGVACSQRRGGTGRRP